MGMVWEQGYHYCVLLFHRAIVDATKMEQLPLLEMKNVWYSWRIWTYCWCAY